MTIGNGDILNVVNDNWAKTRVGPVLQNIINSFCYFKEQFTKQNNNYKMVPVFFNKAFGFGRGIVNKLDDAFFGINPNTCSALRGTLLTLTWTDLTDGDTLLSKETLCAITGLDLS